MILERLTSLLGLAVMVLLAWLMSSDKRRVNLRILIGGLSLQLVLAVLIFETPARDWFLNGSNRVFATILNCVDYGAEQVFGINPRPGDPDLPPRFLLVRSFAFSVLPTIIFFSALMSILYHVGVMQRIVGGMAWVMQRTLRTSGAESLSAAANIFVGHTEAPLVIRPYIAGLTVSELNAVMIGGFATISGGLLGAYAGMGIEAGHLITASVISAPAALLVAKLMQPETGEPQTLGRIKVKFERRSVNTIEAAAVGASDGLRLALNVGAMLLAFLALIALADSLIGWTGSLLGYVTDEGDPSWSLSLALGYAFAPLAWLLGIPRQDCLHAGELLGLKMVANEFIAYDQLGRWIKEGAVISERTTTILTYALSGFSNFGAIGIQIGGIGGLAPERRSDLARLGLRAMIGGTLACMMTACVAGLLL